MAYLLIAGFFCLVISWGISQEKFRVSRNLQKFFDSKLSSGFLTWVSIIRLIGWVLIVVGLWVGFASYEFGS